MPNSRLFSNLSPRAKRILAYIIASIAGLMLIVVLLFTSLKLSVANENWFLAEYESFGLSEELGISSEDMTAAMMRLIDYMNGAEESIQITIPVHGEPVEFYNEREIAHMQDVRRLWQLGENLRMGLLLAAGACFVLIFLLVYSDAWVVFARGILIATALFAVIAGVLYLSISSDFTAFWTSFHEAFFTNDLWLLDPAVDRMIQICPEILFSDIIERFFLMFLFPMGVIAVDAGIIWFIHYKRKKAGF